MPDELLAPIYLEQLNTKFSVMLEDVNVLDLELIKVEDAKARAGFEQFSLVFRGPLEVSLSQGMYRMEHESLEASDVFVVPVARDEQGFYYEACFNRLLS